MAKTKRPDDMVVFLLPDGTEVSNDPRFQWEKMEEQLLAQQENLGVSTMPTGTLKQAGVSAPQSGQPGVGEGAVGAGDRPLTGAEIQRGESENPGRAAQSASHTGREGDFGTRDEEDDDEDYEEDEVEKPYSEWTGAELKAEVKARKRSGREIDTSKAKKKGDLVALLEEDDQKEG